MKPHRWEGAPVPREGTTGVTVRTMPEESERLEELRAALGLRSKSQVIRKALDVLEELFIATDGSELARSETRAMMGRYRDRLGVGDQADAENHTEHRRRARAQLRTAADAVRGAAAAGVDALRTHSAGAGPDVQPAEG